MTIAIDNVVICFSILVCFLNFAYTTACAPTDTGISPRFQAGSDLTIRVQKYKIFLKHGVMTAIKIDFNVGFSHMFALLAKFMVEKSNIYAALSQKSSIFVAELLKTKS